MEIGRENMKLEEKICEETIKLEEEIYEESIKLETCYGMYISTMG